MPGEPLASEAAAEARQIAEGNGAVALLRELERLEAREASAPAPVQPGGAEGPERDGPAGNAAARTASSGAGAPSAS
jgi:hypothetical protein